MKQEELAQAVFDILSDVYEQSPWTLQQVLTDLKQDNTDYFYVYEDQAIIGFMSIQNLVGELELTNIAVKSNYQGQGLASRLLEEIIHRPETIFLEVRASNRPAQELYQKFGFKEVARRRDYYHHPVEDALIMQRLSED
ncbi:ribosomal protein S18-alanine N-acetyltransferase [Streptococcus dentasini]